jgi:hypothetical protein
MFMEDGFIANVVKVLLVFVVCLFVFSHSRFLQFGRKWFQPAEASHLRDSIRILLEKHFKEAEKSIQDTMDDDSLLVVLEDLE